MVRAAATADAMRAFEFLVTMLLLPLADTKSNHTTRGGALFVAYVLAAYWMFAKARIGLNLVYPVFTVAATYTMLSSICGGSRDEIG